LKLGSGKASFIRDDLGFHFFAGECEGDEDGFAVSAGQSRPTVDGFFDAELHYSCLM
jgi:hypothetical protein